MPTFTSYRQYVIFQGTPAAAASAITFYDSESSFAGSTLRRLVYPDIDGDGSGDLPAIDYFSNPDRTINFDPSNGALPALISSVERMSTGSKVTQFEETENDVVVTETWTARQGQTYSTVSAFFRLLYEYYMNPPAFSALDQKYVQWYPRDADDSVYNVILHRLTLGGGNQNNQRFDMKDFQPRGSVNDPVSPATVRGVLDGVWEDVITGVLDRTMQLHLKIVSKV